MYLEMYVYVYCPLRGGRIPGFHRQSIPFRKTTQLPVAHTRLFTWKVNTKFDFPEHAPSCHQGNMPSNLSRIEIRTGEYEVTIVPLNYRVPTGKDVLWNVLWDHVWMLYGPCLEPWQGQCLGWEEVFLW